MTPNEKELLSYFKDLGKANAVTMTKKMDLTAEYVENICQSLVRQGYLDKVTSARKYPVYGIAK